MLKNKETLKKIIIIALIAIMCGIIFYYQTKKIGFHEDEMYSIASSVNPTNGLMTAHAGNPTPTWLSREYVKDYITLTPNNYLNLKAIYQNQAYDNHPPVFYTLVHFSTLIFLGQFSKYSVFIVNIIAFIFSCIIIKKILKLLGKENLVISTLIFYGLSMGTISMVIFQRMYMLLTLFILSYFYYSLKIYKNDFELSKKNLITLGAITILGFLTQYYFAVYAFFIFVLMIIQMFRLKKDKKILITYTISHIIYAIIGILLFVPCINHLIFSDRGLSNLGNSGYIEHLYTYLKHLAYSFTVSPLIMFAILFIFALATIYLYIKNKEKFIIILTIIPSILFFFISVKMTSFQELRYIMPIIPFVAITLFLILDNFIHVKYKNAIITIIAIALVINGIIFSKPKFLFEEYKECLEVAEQNKEKSFVYVYDNFFNHVQSTPEMMIYKKSLIINVNNNELQYLLNDNNLNNEEAFILCIKTYMDNNWILEELKTNTNFKNATKLYENDGHTEEICNTLYLVSK